MSHFIRTLGVAAMAWLLGVFSVGCGDDGPTGSSGEPIPSTIAEAWERFEQSNYSLALAGFQALAASDTLFVEAMTGAGWCLNYLYLPDSAAVCLQRANAEDSLLADVPMGLAVAYYQAGDPGAAIEQARKLLLRDSRYVFSYRTSVDYRDAHLIIGDAAFRLGDLDEARRQIEFLYGDLGLGSPGLPGGHHGAELEQAILSKLENLSARLGG